MWVVVRIGVGYSDRRSGAITHGSSTGTPQGIMTSTTYYVDSVIPGASL